MARLVNVLWAMLMRREMKDDDRKTLRRLVEWPVDPAADREAWGTDAAAEAGQNAMMGL